MEIRYEYLKTIHALQNANEFIVVAFEGLSVTICKCFYKSFEEVKC